ncbi:oligosaccharide flippase family protein [Meridianimarinicoccus sp. RP-17]|uniref:oligosaccharide flippase family protein n=1 Tax=Meridianimarinicoccus zhengii TaxID=2056810 RepID=UPI000DAE2698|nr:oligosaccharide flippase family protein [Phycocomes zhengii]
MRDDRTDPRDGIFDIAGMEKGLGRRAGRASVVALGVGVLRGVLQIGSIAIIARLIPPADYGIYAMALPAVTIGMALSNLGLPQAIVQHRTITHLHVSALFWLNLGLAALIAGLLYAFAGPMSAWYGDDRVMPVLQVISLSLLFSATSGQYISILRRRLRIRETEFLTLAAEILGLAVAIAGALNGLSYWALVLQHLVTPLLRTVFMAVRCRWLPSGPQHVRLGDALQSLRFGGYLAAASIVARLTGYMGTVIAGALFASAAAGLFYRARNIAVLAPHRVTDPLSGVFTSTLSRLQDDADGFRTMFVRLVSRSNLAILPVAVFVAAGSAPLVDLLMGQDWSEAAPLLFWLSLFTFRQGGSTGLQNALVACGRTGALFGFNVARMVLLALVMVTGAQLGGVLTMTIAYTLCELVVTLPLMVAVAGRTTPVTLRTFMAGSGTDILLALGLAGGLAFGLMPRLAGQPAIVQLAVLGAAVGLVYALRIALSPALRGDVLRVLRNVLGRG